MLFLNLSPKELFVYSSNNRMYDNRSKKRLGDHVIVVLANNITGFVNFVTITVTPKPIPGFFCQMSRSLSYLIYKVSSGMPHIRHVFLFLFANNL